ncbi:MAG: alkaline phosphatase D family protein [Myxococcales bacterium]|nr:alkaline phosphatase D family protein [Myxococcales bacterium]
MIGRREWMQRAGLGLGALSATGIVGCGSDEDEPRADPNFLHGVASGDPLPDAIILWTRVTPSVDGPVEVTWELARDRAMTDVVASGEVTTSAARDYTVKVDVTGLEAGTTYFYRFGAEGGRSLVGRTRTAPRGEVDRLRFAVVSCSSYAHGWFHVYRHLAEQPDLDAVLHLGDYIYEYATSYYGSEREYEPPHEIISLSDYRTRYAQYRRDPDLQAVHQQHPFVCVWDDHESANDSWRDGAQNHDPRTEGSWEERIAVAYQAYAEWLPIREQEEGKLWRAFDYGSLADVVMLDTRIWGRDEQASSADEDLADPSRTILGEDQEAWLGEQLAASTAKWKVLGQQVMVGHLSTSSMGEFMPFNLDQWDGYQGARQRLYDQLERTENPIVLTGDIHSHWAIELPRDPFDGIYDPETGAGSVGVELVTSSVSSPGMPDRRIARGLETALLRNNPHIKHINFSYRGWILLDLTPARAQADYWEIDDVVAGSTGDASFRTAFVVSDGERRLVQVDEPTVPRSGAPALAPGLPVRDHLVTVE